MADMFMPEMLWSLVECVGLYQDNISTQLLIKNGKMSSGKKTKHIKAKFFFIKDRVDDGEIKVIDCLTEEMWADVMMKPLQGSAFRAVRAKLMNCEVNYEDPAEGDKVSSILGPKTVSWKKDIASSFKTPQECVGQNKNLLPKRKMDRRSGRTEHPRGMRRRGLGVARLSAPTWHVGEAQEGERKQ